MLHLFSLTATLLSSNASAAGYMAPDSGIVASSRGGAFVAGARGQFAQYYNPAGLINATKQSFTLGVTGINKSVEFDPTAEENLAGPPNEEPYQYGNQSNNGNPMAIPEGGFVRPIGANFVLAIGLTTPTAPNLSYGATGAGRYGLVDLSIINATFGPSLAWRMTPWLTLGVGAQAQMLSIHESIVISTTGSDSATSDLFVDARVQDNFASSYNLGLLLQPTSWLTLGAAYQPGVRFLAKGGLSLDLTGNPYASLAAEEVLTDDAVSIAISLPSVIRAGIMLHPGNRMELEASVVLERWSELSEVTLSNLDVDLGPTVSAPDEIALPSALQDTLSLRLGGEYALDEQLSLRAGGLVESSAVATNDLSLSMTDLPKLMLGTGASYRTQNGKWKFDAVATHTFYLTTEVTDSTASIVNLIDPDGKSDSFGSGTYSASTSTFGAAFTYYFGQG
jgi:long-chain fatty acid transport protein